MDLLLADVYTEGRRFKPYHWFLFVAANVPSYSDVTSVSIVIEQDALPTFPDSEAFACIERELEQPLDSIFSSISPSPIAAASLGQVYKAQLRYSGQVVAVKVQRPGIEEAIGLDFYLIRGVGFFINKYVDIITSDVVALIDEFASRVYQELNYVQVSFFRYTWV